MASLGSNLVLSNISATFEKDKDIIGKQDPYLIFECGNEKVTTSTIKKGGTECVWEESYPLHKGSGGDLKVTAYNKNTLMTDSLLGVGELKLNKCTSNETNRILLLSKTGGEVGEVMVKVSGAGTGASVGRTGTVAGVGAGAGQHGTQVAGSGMTGGGAAGQRGVAGAGAGTGISTHQTTTGHTNNRARMAGATGVAAGATAGYHTHHHGADDSRGVHTLDMNLGGTAADAGARGAPTHGHATDKALTGTGGEVCDQQFHSKVEDVVTEKEEVIRFKEHRPVEKTFVVETRPTGQVKDLHDKHHDEHLDRVVRTVGEEKGNPCSGTHTGKTMNARQAGVEP